MSKEIIAKAAELIAQRTGIGSIPGAEPYCVLALIDSNGYPTASTITAAKADGIERLFLCTGLGSNKTNRINACNRASICFSDGTYNITLVGTIEILTDEAIKKEMWYSGLTNHFSGSDDSQYCVLSFKTERYNLFVEWHEVTGTI